MAYKEDSLKLKNTMKKKLNKCSNSVTENKVSVQLKIEQ